MAVIGLRASVMSLGLGKEEASAGVVDACGGGCEAIAEFRSVFLIVSSSWEGGLEYAPTAHPARQNVGGYPDYMCDGDTTREKKQAKGVSPPYLGRETEEFVFEMKSGEGN